MAAVTAVVVVGWWLRRCRPLRRWLWGVGDSDDAGRYDGGCGGLVTPTVAASRVKTLTDPAVDGHVVFFGGADFSSCNYGGCSLYFQIKQRFDLIDDLNCVYCVCILNSGH